MQFPEARVCGRPAGWPNAPQQTACKRPSGAPQSKPKVSRKNCRREPRDPEGDDAAASRIWPRSATSRSWVRLPGPPWWKRLWANARLRTASGVQSRNVSLQVGHWYSAGITISFVPMVRRWAASATGSTRRSSAGNTEDESVAVRFPLRRPVCVLDPRSGGVRLGTCRPPATSVAILVERLGPGSLP